MGAGVGGGGKGRRQPTGGGVSAPGSGLAGGPQGAGGSTPGSSGGGPGFGSGQGGYRPPTLGGDRSDGRSEKGQADLEKMAPLPTKPSIYPAGSTYYRFPITFEIEILDASQLNKVEATVRGTDVASEDKA